MRIHTLAGPRIPALVLQECRREKRYGPGAAGSAGIPDTLRLSSASTETSRKSNICFCRGPVTTSRLIRLVADGSLVLEVERSCLPAAAPWIPRFPTSIPTAPDFGAQATVQVLPARSPGPAPPLTKPSLALSGVSAWIDDASGLVRLYAGHDRAHGTIDLDSRCAELFVPQDDTASRNDAVFTMLTIGSALLLGRLRRTLIHAAGAVAPNGGCWLLVGDARAGKTTTTINLIRGGWGFLSDDHVVVSDTDVGPSIEGWPRPFHVDAGWAQGDIAGIRKPVDPGEFGADLWARTAPLAGLLFPQVNADAPTRLHPLPPATSLSLLIRQTPWLLADRGSAYDLLALLGRMASLPSFRLSAGRDSYADSEALLRQFEGIAPGRASSSADVEGSD